MDQHMWCWLIALSLPKLFQSLSNKLKISLSFTSIKASCLVHHNMAFRLNTQLSPHFIDEAKHIWEMICATVENSSTQCFNAYMHHMHHASALTKSSVLTWSESTSRIIEEADPSLMFWNLCWPLHSIKFGLFKTRHWKWISNQNTIIFV